jgi:glycosyltransferase involved in cell wall biosynthesis
VSVLFLIQGPPEVASSRTRAYAYLPILASAGVRTEVHVWNSPSFVARQMRGRVPFLSHAANSLGRLLVAWRVLRASRRHDAIYIQKVILPRWFLRALKSRGRRLVFDYDDALYALAPGQEIGVRALVRRHRIRRFTNCLSAADLVVIENEPNRSMTERFCPRTLTITGPIDTERYRPFARIATAEVVIGWVGSPSTTSYLRMVEPVLRQLSTRYRIALHLIGAAPITMEGVVVRQFPWTLDSEVAELAKFDIGIMPLTDDPWSRGKGGYKLLQYMAMGIPAVASPVGINAELIRDGETGLLAPDERAWEDALERLVAGAALRRDLGAAARADVVGRFSLEHYVPLFLDALLPADAQGTGDRRPLQVQGIQP